MESLLVLLLLAFLGCVVAAPIVGIVKAIGLRREVNALHSALEGLRRELRDLRRAAPPSPPCEPAPKPAAAPVVAAAPVIDAAASASDRAPSGAVREEAPPVAAQAPVSTPPPLPAPRFAAEAARPAAPPERPPPVAEPPSEPAAEHEAPPAPAFNWEQFMGVKLFAGAGGLAFLLAAAFFLKLSFDRGWFPPPLRAAMGFVFGAGLLVGGLASIRRAYAVTGQALCAAGVVVLYTVTFACRAFYKFEFFGPGPTFALMVAITAVAFLLAVRLRAQIIAVLGLAGGFLAPVLVSTGEYNALGLFTYVALLDAGLLAIALRCRWQHLVLLAVAGTAALQAGWAGKFFLLERLPVAVAVCAAFVALFTAAVAVARRLDRASEWLTASALVPPVVAALFSVWFCGMPAVAARPGWVLGNVLIADLALLVIAVLHAPFARAHLAGGLAALGVTALWIVRAATPELLPWALGFVFLFAAAHAVYPFVQRRWVPDRDETAWSGLFGPLGLLVLVLAVVRFDEAGWLVWPVVLLLDLVALATAAATGLLAALAGAIVLSLAALAMAIVRQPMHALGGGGSEIALVAGFAVLFVAGSVWMVRRLAKRGVPENSPPEPAWLTELPGGSALMPFALLALLVLRLRPGDPSAVFGVALLLTVLACGLAAVARQGLLVVAAMAGTLALQYLWHRRAAPAGGSGIALAWAAGFSALFMVFPFVFRRRLLDVHAPWAAAALALPLHFALIRRNIVLLWPNDVQGLLALVCALPPLFSLVAVLRVVPAGAAFRLNRLAWFGAATLFFVTLVFPLQCSNQWLTAGWALEGAALAWLYRRIPHGGLRIAGVALLAAVFARLVLNPWVFEYAARGERPVFNWILATYGTAVACCFGAARLLAPPRDRVAGLSMPAVLATLGTILAFALLNLEIADAFTPVGERLRMEFSGNFARDMSYTIGWAVFALTLAVAGALRRLRAARIAGIALLLVTLAKLFLHDLVRLDPVYRIGAFLAVAVVATAASAVFQRFWRTPK
jgi:hypothetical protein